MKTTPRGQLLEDIKLRFTMFRSILWSGLGVKSGNGRESLCVFNVCIHATIMSGRLTKDQLCRGLLQMLIGKIVFLYCGLRPVSVCGESTWAGDVFFIGSQEETFKLFCWYVNITSLECQAALTLNCLGLGFGSVTGSAMGLVNGHGLINCVNLSLSIFFFCIKHPHLSLAVS